MTPGLLVRREGDRATRLESYQFALEPVGPLFQPRTLAVLAVLALLASLGTLMGLRVRAGRGLPQTEIQRLAAALQVLAAVAWLTSAGAAGVFALSEVRYVWPTPAILVFSSAALLATLLSGGAGLLLPPVWRGRPDTAGWTWWRKLRFTLATAVFVVFGGVLALWGALQPWNP